MTAGTDGQEAMEYRGHGLFTYFLLDALKGAADRDRDGFITSLEISQHLATQVPAIAKRKMKKGQTPQTGRMGQGEMVFRSRNRPVAKSQPDGGGRVGGARSADNPPTPGLPTMTTNRRCRP